jgi:hypothetical protein
LTASSRTGAIGSPVSFGAGWADGAQPALW